MARGTDNTQEHLPPPGKPAGARRMRHVAEAAIVLAVTILTALLLRVFVVEAYRVPTRSMESTLLAGDFVFVNKLAYGIRGGGWLPAGVIAPLFSSPAPRQGDVVVFHQPGPDPARTLIKRCVAVPGDSVLVAGDRVFVNRVEAHLPVSSAPGAAGTVGAAALTAGGATRWILLPRRGQCAALDSGSVERWRPAIEAEGHTITLAPGNRALVDGVDRPSHTFREDQYFVLGDNSGDSRDSREWGPVLDERIIGKAILIYWSRDETAAAGSFGAGLGAIRWPRIGTVVR